MYVLALPLLDHKLPGVTNGVSSLFSPTVFIAECSAHVGTSISLTELLNKISLSFLFWISH